MYHLFEKINNGDVYIIAEMSANHGGNISNALEIVRQAAKAGAESASSAHRQSRRASSLRIVFMTSSLFRLLSKDTL